VATEFGGRRRHRPDRPSPRHAPDSIACRRGRSDGAQPLVAV